MGVGIEMEDEACPNCGTWLARGPGQPLDCPECGFVGDPHEDPQSEPVWGLLDDLQLSSEEEKRARSGANLALRLGAIAAFAIGLGLVLIGVGNGIWRLTEIGDPQQPTPVLGFLFHIATAATLVILGATLLPSGLHLLSRDPREEASLRQSAIAFSVLWLVVGFFSLFVGTAGRPQNPGAGIVLMLAGVFGLIAISIYDPLRKGSSMMAGVLGLVGGGLLIGGAAAAPSLIAESQRFGAELVFRYAAPTQASGYLVGILAAAVYPFVRSNRSGRAAVLLVASLGGVLWGVGELAFGVTWLADTPWTLLGQLDPGGSAGYGFVVAGGFATIVGGIVGLGASLGAATYAAVPLASAIPEAGSTRPPGNVPRGSRHRECPSCEAITTTSADYCPGCGEKLPSWEECPACGTAIAEDAAYCSDCGTEIAAEA